MNSFASISRCYALYDVKVVAMATASQDSIPRHLMTPPGLVLKDSGVEDGTIGKDKIKIH